MKKFLCILSLLLITQIFFLSSVFADPAATAAQTQQELNENEQKISEIKAKIIDLQTQIAVNNAQLPQKQAEYENLRNLASERMRAMYMQGNDDYLSYLFSAKDMNEMLSRAQNIKNILQSDTEMLQQTQSAKEDLDASSTRIAEAAAQLQAEQAEAEALSAKLGTDLANQIAAAQPTPAPSVATDSSNSNGAASNKTANMDSSAAISSIATSSSPKVSKFIEIMKTLCNDNTYGYSQASRWGPDFDCTSSIIYSLRQAGFQTGSANTAGNIVDITNYGWTKIDTNNLAAGDILVNPNYHCALYIGNGQIAEFSDDYDGRSGDSSGNEAHVHSYYNFPWSYALRCTSE